jgi:SAM-dependent methyltransferase
MVFNIDFAAVMKDYGPQVVKFLKNRLDPKHYGKIKQMMASKDLAEFIGFVHRFRSALKPETGDRFDYHADMYAKFIRENYKVGKGTTILDFGCNTGNILVNIAKALKVGKRDRYGVDIIDVRGTKEFTFIKTVAGENVINLPDESINIVIASMVFHHVDDLGILDELRRILKPGGIIVVREHDIIDDVGFTSFLELVHHLYYDFDMIKVPTDTYFARYWTLDQLRGIMRKHGFDCGRVKQMNNVYRAYYAIFKKIKYSII